MTSITSRDSILQSPKYVKLKDYLRDDLHSSSSNGFKSIPRKQCCPAIRFKIVHPRTHTRSSKIRFFSSASKQFRASLHVFLKSFSLRKPWKIERRRKPSKSPDSGQQPSDGNRLPSAASEKSTTWTDYEYKYEALYYGYRTCFDENDVVSCCRGFKGEGQNVDKEQWLSPVSVLDGGDVDQSDNSSPSDESCRKRIRRQLCVHGMDAVNPEDRIAVFNEEDERSGVVLKDAELFVGFTQEVCVREMERDGKWRRVEVGEEEVGMVVAYGIWADLVTELLAELTTL